MEIFQWNLHLCQLVWKWRIEQYILGSCLEFVKVWGYDFPHPYDDLWTVEYVTLEVRHAWFNEIVWFSCQNSSTHV
jgi:hypothetical protein